MLYTVFTAFLADLFSQARRLPHQGFYCLCLLLLTPLNALAADPVITSTPLTRIDEDSFYSYTVIANDPDGGALTFSAPTLPAWLTFNTGDATLSGTPTNDDVGNSSVVVRVSDGVANVEQLFSIVVINVNDQPTVVSNIANVTLTEDVEFTLDVTANFEDVDINDIVTYSGTDLPSGLGITPQGVITGAPTNQDAFDSPFNVTITATDLEKTSASTFFQIIVTNVNDAPTPANDSATLSEDSNVIIDILKNDVDVDDVLLPSTVFIITQPLHGEATVNTTNGLITYVPNPDYAGADSLEYRITDPLGLAGTAIVNINVLPVNDAPVAQNDVVSTQEDTLIEIDVLANDSDPDVGDAPQGSQLVVESPPSNGSVLIINGQLHYTPDANFNGTDSLQYKAADLNGVFTNVATVTITVGAVNDIPIAGDDIANTLEDTTVNIVVINNDSDTEDPVLDVATIVIVNAPTNGTASLNTDGTIAYTPNLNYNGSDSLQYTVKDSRGLTSNAATVSITVNPVNDAPIANSDSVTLDEDTLLEINILGNDTDVDGNDTIDVSTVDITTNPTNGTLFLDTTNGVVRYTPNADFFGTDNFFYRITDKGGLNSGIAQVALVITSVNDSPRLTDDSAITDEDTPVTISILPNDADVDGTLDLTTLTFTQQPAHGTVTFNALGEVVFEPELNYHGNDLFSYTISDNEGLVSASAASVLITINSINDAPLADSNALSVREDKTLDITLTGSDVDGDVLDFVITLQPRNGVLSGTGANISYTPNENYNGSDSFNFQSTDGSLNSTTANIRITVIPINDRPVATPQTVTLNEDESISFILTGTDIDEDSLTFALAGGNLSGIVTGSPPNITYTPAENFNGEEHLSFFANDGELDSSVEKITMRILAINDVPTVTSQDLFLSEDSSVSFTLEAEDIDGDTLSFVIDRPPANGTLSGIFPQQVYTPDENFFGDDFFTYQVNDGSVSSDLGTVKLRVSPNSDVPTADGQAVVGNEDSDIPITLTGSDPDGNVLSYQIVTVPTHGTLEGTPPNLSYRAEANYYGSDNLAFKVSDGNFNSNTAIVNITVNPVNDAPTAIDDSFSLSMAGKQWLTLDVLNNDIDLDEDDLTLLSVQVDFGIASVNDNHIRYAPEQGFAGDVFMSYLVEDPAGKSDTARVRLTVTDNGNVNAPEVTPPDDINMIAQGIVTKVNLGAATAVDSQGNIIPVSLLSNNDSFKPGAHKVFWKATDNQGNTAIASQTVNIFPQVSLSQGQQVEEGNEVTVKFRLNGLAPVYPIVVPYMVEGDATAGIDYELSAGEVRFEEGTLAELTFETFVDQTDEAAEQVVIKIGDTPYASSESSHTVTMVEHNILPRITLTSFQNSQQRFLIEQVGGPVIVLADIEDPNAQDGHSIEWLPGEGIVRGNPATETHFAFSVQDMPVGVYYLAATVTDGGEPELTAQTQIYIEVVESLPELGNGDTDGDLISDNIEGYRDEDGDHIPDYNDPVSNCNVLPEKADEHQRFLIEGQTGGCLRLGSFSTANLIDGVMLDDGAISSLLPTDPDTTNVGGLFDFEIHNLSSGTTSYHLVIPQRQPVPADAVYRKYSQEKGWYTFVEDDHNSVWSAAGSHGICPSPKDIIWVKGLHEGDWCVQLTIEDGGANDNDGLVNHSIIDPGGVALYKSSNKLPVAEPDTAVVKWNTTTQIEVLENDSDGDNDSLVIISAGAQLGNAEINQGLTINYEAPENYIGEDVVNYSISDGHGGVSSTTLTITIKGNSTPNAEDDAASTTSKVAIIVDVVSNDSDEDNDALTIISATTTVGAVVITNNNKLQFTPQQDFEGTVTITYVISDPSDATDEGQLLVAVTKIAEPPPPPPPPIDPPADSGGDSGGTMQYWLVLLLGLGLVRRKRG